MARKCAPASRALAPLPIFSSPGILIAFVFPIVYLFLNFFLWPKKISKPRVSAKKDCWRAFWGCCFFLTRLYFSRYCQILLFIYSYDETSIEFFHRPNLFNPIATSRILCKSVSMHSRKNTHEKWICKKKSTLCSCGVKFQIYASSFVGVVQRGVHSFRSPEQRGS